MSKDAGGETTCGPLGAKLVTAFNRLVTAKPANVHRIHRTGGLVEKTGPCRGNPDTWIDALG